jgi:hypothetical protein
MAVSRCHGRRGRSLIVARDHAHTFATMANIEGADQRLVQPDSTPPRSDENATKNTATECSSIGMTSFFAASYARRGATAPATSRA